MANLQIYIQGWIKIIGYWWPVIIFAAYQMYKLWRWENDQKRAQEAIKRDRLKRVHYKEHFVYRNQITYLRRLNMKREKAAYIKIFYRNRIKHKGIYINGLCNSIYECGNEVHEEVYAERIAELKSLGYQIVSI